MGCTRSILRFAAVAVGAVCLLVVAMDTIPWPWGGSCGETPERVPAPLPHPAAPGSLPPCPPGVAESLASLPRGALLVELGASRGACGPTAGAASVAIEPRPDVAGALAAALGARGRVYWATPFGPAGPVAVASEGPPSRYGFTWSRPLSVDALRSEDLVGTERLVLKVEDAATHAVRGAEGALRAGRVEAVVARVGDDFRELVELLTGRGFRMQSLSPAWVRFDRSS